MVGAPLVGASPASPSKPASPLLGVRPPMALRLSPRVVFGSPARALFSARRKYHARMRFIHNALRGIIHNARMGFIYTPIWLASTPPVWASSTTLVWVPSPPPSTSASTAAPPVHVRLCSPPAPPFSSMTSALFLLGVLRQGPPPPPSLLAPRPSAAGRPFQPVWCHPDCLGLRLVRLGDMLLVRLGFRPFTACCPRAQALSSWPIPGLYISGFFHAAGRVAFVPAAFLSAPWAQAEDPFFLLNDTGTSLFSPFPDLPPTGLSSRLGFAPPAPAFTGCGSMALPSSAWMPPGPFSSPLCPALSPPRRPHPRAGPRPATVTALGTPQPPLPPLGPPAFPLRLGSPLPAPARRCIAGRSLPPLA
ncbi:hypothetical protein V8E36_000477 [Tilletia maclaganii]